MVILVLRGHEVSHHLSCLSAKPQKASHYCSHSINYLSCVIFTRGGLNEKCTDCGGSMRQGILTCRWHRNREGPTEGGGTHVSREGGGRHCSTLRRPDSRRRASGCSPSGSLRHTGSELYSPPCTGSHGTNHCRGTPGFRMI